MFSKTFRLSVLLIFCTVFSISAQDGGYSLTLKLIENGTGDPVEFATVSLTADGAKSASNYALTDDKGVVTIKRIKKGKYTLKAELLGYKTHSEEIAFDKDVRVDLGDVKMEVEVNALSGAVVSDVGNPIIVKKDTVEYQASSFKTSENDMLVDLLKKLPGVEVSSDGTITANGKTISKITIDGKTFFLDDPQLASNNIPAKIVEKVKVLEKKSDEAEFTGIDDGNEETVIDLSVMKGMMNGWFGNFAGGGGYDLRFGGSDADAASTSQASVTENKPRFQASGILARFTEDNQLSFIANANNTNNRGFDDMASSMMSGARGGRGMGGMGGRGGMGGMGFRGNGITTSYMTGFNGSKTFADESEITGNALFSGNDQYVEEGTSKTTYQNDGSTLYYNSDGTSRTETYNVRAGGRGIWEVSKSTSFIFEPSFNFGWGSFDERQNYGTDESPASDSEKRSSVNSGDSRSSGYNQSKGAEGFLLWRQRLGKAGRTLSVSMDYDLSNNDLTDGLNRSNTYTYGDGVSVTDSSIVNQMYGTRTKSYSLSARATYNEPLSSLSLRSP